MPLAKGKVSREKRDLRLSLDIGLGKNGFIPIPAGPLIVIASRKDRRHGLGHA
jgi:hypothetical protein